MAYQFKYVNKSTKISHEHVVSKIIKPTTGTSVGSIYGVLGNNSEISRNRSKVVDAPTTLAILKSYSKKTDINLDAAYRRFDQYALERAITDGKELENSLGSREKIKLSKEVRKAERKQRFEKIREETKQQQKATEEQRVMSSEKKKKNIQRSREASRGLELQSQVQDMVIDF